MSAPEKFTHNRITLAILARYFPVVSTLRECLEAVLEDDGACLGDAQSAGSEQFTKLLDLSYVATHSPLADQKRILPAQPMSHMHEVGRSAYIPTFRGLTWIAGHRSCSRKALPQEERGPPLQRDNLRISKSTTDDAYFSGMSLTGFGVQGQSTGREE